LYEIIILVVWDNYFSYIKYIVILPLIFKIWCAAGVNLTGGRTRDGGSIVGASVFYSNPADIEQEPNYLIQLN
jgi:hypothetical protein